MNDPITELRENRSLGSQEELDNFIAALGLLPPEPSQELISQLLQVFDDEADMPNVMFDLVHFIERAPPGAEEAALLRDLPAFVSRAPWWAETLVMRLLNNGPSRAALVDAAADAPASRGPLLAVLRTIAEGNDDVARRAAETIPLISSQPPMEGPA